MGGFAETGRARLAAQSKAARESVRRQLEEDKEQTEAVAAAAKLENDQVVFREAFAIIDSDHSGTVEAAEVLKTLKVFGKVVDEKTFWDVFRELDLDGNTSCGLLLTFSPLQPSFYRDVIG